MNRLCASFQRIRDQSRRALLPFITAGYPDDATTIALLQRIDPERCACVELGVPFSDPIADGPVIQTSFSRALERGFRLPAFLDTLRGARPSIAVPLVAMISYSIVFRKSPERFVADAAAAGIDGLIVPDLPIEEAAGLATLAQTSDCPLVLIVAPTSDADRRARIAALSEPFIYYQAVAGVTGERSGLPHDLIDNVRRLRQKSGKPVCVGFGISEPAHVVAVCQEADGAIVGSAIVRRMNAAVDRGATSGELCGEVVRFIDDLTAGLPPPAMSRH